MKANIGIVIFSIVFLILYLFLLLLDSYPIFDVQSRLIKEITCESLQIEFYYVNGNATMQDNIQLRLTNATNHKSVLKNYEGYNYIISTSYYNDTLKIVLTDTSMQYLQQDTFMLTINDCNLGSIADEEIGFRGTGSWNYNVPIISDNKLN